LKSFNELSFAAGHNRALERAKADRVMLLNNDTEVEFKPISIVGQGYGNQSLGLYRFFASSNGARRGIAI
jgi:hypothetical protein